MPRLTLLWFLLSLTFHATGQYFIGGQEPARTKWLEKETEFGRIIYSKEADSASNQFIGYMRYAWRTVPSSLNHFPKPIPIVVHTSSILSNGFVSWAPKRMEVITTPSPDQSPEPAMLTLAIHETRHVVQVDRLNKGIFKVGSFLIGEQAIAPAAAMVPLWFFEGDAIYSETELSNSGRGREASFYQYYRTHLLSNGGNRFPYDKWLLGSYKDIIPNHYNFGYLMVGYGYLKYGSKLWNNSLDYVSYKPYSVIPFFFSMLKDTGLNRKKYHANSMVFLDSLWKGWVKDENYMNNHQLIPSKGKTYTTYRFPFLINDSTLIALKSSQSKPTALIKININSGHEVVLHYPGSIIGKLSYNNGMILWAEHRPHSRWEYLNYSEVWIYNIAKEQAKRITSKAKLVNPIGSSNGSIIAVEYNSNGKASIVEFSFDNKRLNTILFPFTVEPKEVFFGNDSLLFVRASSPDGTMILRYNSFETKPDTVFGPFYRNIYNISYFEGAFYFNISHAGKEELAFHRIESNQTLLFQTSRYGLRQPYIYEENQIIISEWSEKGLYPVIAMKQVETEPLNLSSPTYGLFGEGKTNGSRVDLDDLSSSNSREHSTVKNLFYFHSWAPAYYDPYQIMGGDFEVFPGLTLLSQNLTSTLISRFGYSYNETHGGHAYLHWMGWYPIITFGADVGHFKPSVIGGPFTGVRNEPNVETTINIQFPVELSEGNKLIQLSPTVSYSFYNTWVYSYQINNYLSGFDALEFGLSFYRISRRAVRDIRPTKGFYVYTGLTSSPYVSSILGESWFSSGTVYFPGILTNHSLLLQCQYEKQWVKDYARNSRLMFPKGYSRVKIEKGFSGSINYAFPIAYPDLPISFLAYFKRFFANIFYDLSYFYTHITNDQGLVERATITPSSMGVELYSNINFLRTPFDFNLGFRASYQVDSRTYMYEFLYTFNPGSLFGFSRTPYSRRMN